MQKFQHFILCRAGWAVERLAVREYGMRTHPVRHHDRILVSVINITHLGIKMNTKSVISISNTPISQDDAGRYCLNDLHKASGGEDKNRPTYWLKLQQTIDLQNEVEIDGIPSILSKQGLGTFAAKELVYAYAMWISPKFHLAVIRAYDAMVTEKPKQNRTNDLTKTAKTYKALLAMAKLSGLSGNQALLAADSATKKIENHSPLALLGVDLICDVKEKTITPSDIGKQIGGLSPQKVNKLLMEQGYQINLRDLHDNVYWQPTDKGKPFGEMIDTQKQSSDGSPVKQWRWYLSIVDHLASSNHNNPINGLVVLEGAA